MSFVLQSSQLAFYAAQGLNPLPSISEYRGENYIVRVRAALREALSIEYIREGSQLILDGERIGNNWEGIKAIVPPNLGEEKTATLVTHLKAAFQGLGIEYMVIRPLDAEPVDEIDRHAAIANLRDMGIAAEVTSDGKRANLKKLPGALRGDPEAARKQALRLMFLVNDVRGSRPRFEILAKSKEF